VEKERLEKELSAIAWSMKNLSLKSQQHTALTPWKPKTGDKQYELKLFNNGPIHCTLKSAV